MARLASRPLLDKLAKPCNDGGMARPAGIRGLAKLAGVAPSTISRALADNPRVNVDTRRRIQDLAREQGFQLNQAASAFRRQRANAVSVVLPLGHDRAQHMSDPFFMGLIAQLADALTEIGYDLWLSRVIPKDRHWLKAIAASGRVDGLIVIGQSDQIDVIEDAAVEGIPLVVWGAFREDLRQVTVGTDNVRGGRLAAEHLVARGRSRLAFLGDIGAPEFAARYAGFEWAAREAGITGELTALPVHLTTEESYRTIVDFLSSRPAPDGVLCASDVIAMSTLRALAERGLAAPRDVSVVGFDDVPLASHTAPPLTTVRQNIGRGARTMVALLQRQLAGEQVSSVLMQPELVVRGSS